MEPEFLLLPEMAKFMGRSEPAIRSALSRGDDWLPKPDRQGGRLCWSVSEVRQFILDRRSATNNKPKVGRPRVLPQLVGQRVGR
jgi:predicted DNA-binding transcriptional regulator AlpA